MVKSTMQSAFIAVLLGLGLANSDDSAMQNLPVGAQPLYFKACSSVKAETWELVPSQDQEGLVAVKSRLTHSCVDAGTSPLTTAPCNLTSERQLFHWNATTKNGLPKGTTGFVRVAGSAIGCPDKGGGGSYGCCMTNNGLAGAAMWGCCPSFPSDCGNQVIRLHADGTLRDNRNPADCLQYGHAAHPPPPPPGPPQSTVPDPFEKLGARQSLCFLSSVTLFTRTLRMTQECQTT